MKEKTKFVAFSTQKGGAGKTTLTVLAASYLHYVKGFNVAVIDCDYPQHSIVEMRERDLKLALEDEHYKRLAYEQFTRLQKKAYPVVESNTKEALADADYLLPQGDFDYVFFDLYEQSGLLSKAAFIKARVFNEAFRVVKTDRGTLEYVAKLTAFHAQFRAIGTNYNQVVKELHAHFSEKKTLALLYKLERATRELAAVGQQVVSLSEEFKQRW